MHAKLTTLLACAALAGCQLDDAASVQLSNARATLHETSEGWVVDGTADLLVIAGRDATETWLMSLGMATSEASAWALATTVSSAWTDPSAELTVAPVSAFPLRTEAFATSEGTVSFHGAYPSGGWAVGDCQTLPHLWIVGGFYDESGLDRMDRYTGLQPGDATTNPARVPLTCQPAP